MGTVIIQKTFHYGPPVIWFGFIVSRFGLHLVQRFAKSDITGSTIITYYETKIRPMFKIHYQRHYCTFSIVSQHQELFGIHYICLDFHFLKFGQQRFGVVKNIGNDRENQLFKYSVFEKNFTRRTCNIQNENVFVNWFIFTCEENVYLAHGCHFEGWCRKAHLTIHCTSNVVCLCTTF